VISIVYIPVTSEIWERVLGHKIIPKSLNFIITVEDGNAKSNPIENLRTLCALVLFR